VVRLRPAKPRAMGDRDWICPCVLPRHRGDKGNRTSPCCCTQPPIRLRVSTRPPV